MNDIEKLGLGNSLYYIGSKKLKNGEYVYYISSKKQNGTFELRTSKDYHLNYLDKVSLSGYYKKCAYKIKSHSLFQIEGAALRKLNKE
ncbi:MULTISPECIES: hypothetical protein [Staphylococcus]|uniref:Uncharacterized protein n=1 Tax=Staphylococcus agnetis TaxID=985762 RepID=A0ABX3Z3Q6_9STAP|nr:MULTISPECIES: hypothetical protein [Staphylococcus]ALN77497.1 hypothetical protein EP23_09110 [Staphylococcus agnetis]EZU79050.1 hypothetical protein U995_02591 [Staphylococcus aureus 1111203374]MDG4943474.1 hypothetical protein [Staphylococcus agnetis]OSP14897.1 hypothetical protein B9L42_11680 [Staphylococcus agnetis]OSP22707.1 hypothetical protein B9M87_11300 [Staphylococcus agnetis]